MTSMDLFGRIRPIFRTQSGEKENRVANGMEYPKTAQQLNAILTGTTMYAPSIYTDMFVKFPALCQIAFVCF